MGFVLDALYALGILVPWLTIYVSASQECGWELGFRMAFLSKTPFGTDFVFTYGPWGFVFSKLYHPSLYGLTVGIRSVLAVWFVASARILAKRVWHDNPVMVTFICALVVSMASLHRDAIFIILAALPAVDYFYPELDGDGR